MIYFLPLLLMLQFDDNVIREPNVISQISAEEILKIAEDTHQYTTSNILDYTGIFIKREMVNGKDTGYQYIEFKYREKPRGIYLKFLKPASLQEREVLYNGGDDLIVKRGGRSNSKLTLAIGIDSPVALEGNKYTIDEMGFKVLGERLIQRLKEEARIPETVFKIYDSAKIDGRDVVHYKMIHVASPHYKTTCLIAEVAIDKELKIPIYYRALDKDKEGNWIVLEEYGFRNIKLNVGLTDEDFSEDNKEYGFQKTP